MVYLMSTIASGRCDFFVVSVKIRGTAKKLKLQGVMKPIMKHGISKSKRGEKPMRILCNAIII